MTLWTDDKAAMLTDIDARLAELDRLEAAGLEPTLAVHAAELRHWLRDLRDAVEDDDPKVGEVLAQRDRADLWVRHPDLFETGAIADDPASGTVTLRPELVPPDLRKAALSAVSELADIYWHRSVGGRPRNNPPR